MKYSASMKELHEHKMVKFCVFCQDVLNVVSVGIGFINVDVFSTDIKMYNFSRAFSYLPLAAKCKISFEFPLDRVSSRLRRTMFPNFLMK
jgi:hypothetical protein